MAEAKQCAETRGHGVNRFCVMAMGGCKSIPPWPGLRPGVVALSGVAARGRRGDEWRCRGGSPFTKLLGHPCWVRLNAVSRCLGESASFQLVKEVGGDPFHAPARWAFLHRSAVTVLTSARRNAQRRRERKLQGCATRSAGVVLGRTSPTSLIRCRAAPALGRHAGAGAVSSCCLISVWNGGQLLGRF